MKWNFADIWVFMGHPVVGGLVVAIVMIAIAHAIPKFREVINAMCTAPRARKQILDRLAKGDKRFDDIEAHLKAQDKIQDAILTAVAGEAVSAKTRREVEGSDDD